MPFVESVNTTNANSVGDRTGWQGTQYLSVIPRVMRDSPFPGEAPSSILAQGSINGYAPPIPNTQISFTLASGLTFPTTIKAGMRVIVYEDDIRKPLAQYRVRADGDGTRFLKINETNIPYDNNRTLSAAVLDDFMLREKLPFYNTGTGTQFKDYDIAFHRPDPLIYDLEGAYIAYTNNSGASFSLSPQAYKVEAGLFQTAITWEWDLEDGSFTSGTSTSREITASFPTGFRWINVTATFVHTGRSTTRYIPVWVHHPTDFPPVLGFNGASITGDIDNGYNATIEVFNVDDTNWNVLDAQQAQPKDWIDNALCIVWTVNEYKGGFTPKGKGESFNGYDDNNCAIDFIGRVSTDTTGQDVDIQHANLNRPVQLQVDGIAEQLRKTPSVAVTLQDTDTIATEWDTIRLLTLYRGAAHYLSTMTSITDTVSIEFDTDVSLSNDVYRIGFPINMDDGNVYDTISAWLAPLHKMQFTPQGEIKIIKDVRMFIESASLSSNLIGGFSNADLFSYTLSNRHRDIIRRVVVKGISWIESTSSVALVEGYFPETTPTSGLQNVALTNVVFPRNGAGNNGFLTALRVFEKDNSRYELTVEFPDGYHFLTPYAGGVYTWTIEEADNERGLSFDTSTYWILQSITHQHDNQTGTRNVSATFRSVDKNYLPDDYE